MDDAGRRGCDGEAVYVIVRAAWHCHLTLTSLHMPGTLHSSLASFMFSYTTTDIVLYAIVAVERHTMNLEFSSEPARV
jgi:hypothetical protein